MANLGNAWHIPGNPEPPGLREGMRTPVFPTVGGSVVTVWSGNQFSGAGNPGNQLQDGSAVFFREAPNGEWTAAPLVFGVQVDTNKYFSAAIPIGDLQAGATIEYYLRIAYDDHDTTFLQLNADGTTSLAVADEADAQAAPFTFSIDTPQSRGQWGNVLPLPNVGIHSHVLPNGKVLMWGRRDRPDQSLDVMPASPLQPGGPVPPAATCTPFLWDPSSGESTATPAPTMVTADGETNANLFCSGHAFLPDGRLLVAGGHFADGAGLAQTILYSPETNTWTPSATMTNGRWYPTLTTLPDGNVLILAGSYRDADGSSVPNTTPEFWTSGALTDLAPNPTGALDLYPRIHVVSDGRVITTGSLQQTWSFDVSNGGWTKAGAGRLNGQRDYAPSVLYDVDKAIYIGGGKPPTAETEVADLSQAQPQWTVGSSMTFPRRQHNATILADGTVLVTGGTRSGGSGPPQDFNNLDPGQPVHIAELWDPATGQYSQLAAESVDRCYHSTAVLLPDATVLSAGGGEFFPIEGIPQQNDPADSHRDAQVFSPPYLFKGDRPVISAAPEAVSYGETFHVSTPQSDDVVKVTWVRLSSVTHSFNTGQRFARLDFVPSRDGLDVTAPASAHACPPGHYLLFLINQEGVPSVAKILAISAAPELAPPTKKRAVHSRNLLGGDRPAPQDAFALRRSVLAAATGTKVVIGLTGTCPYGIAACWGGANEGLRHLAGVQYIDPIPDGTNSTATVFLADDALPPLELWRQQFHRIVNDSYRIRGVEVTLTGPIEESNGELLLGYSDRSVVRLAPLDPTHKVQWDRANRRPQAEQPGEGHAFTKLASQARTLPPSTFTVTGPLVHSGTDYTLEVRQFVARSRP